MCNLTLNRDQKTSLITKIDCMGVTDLNPTVRHICHVVDSFFLLPKVFYENCLFNTSDQKVLRIVSSCICFNFYLGIFFGIALPSSSTFAAKSCLSNKNKGFNAQQRSLHDCKIPQQFYGYHKP